MSLQEKIIRLKLDALIAAKHAAFWQNAIAQYGEVKAEAFYRHIGLNHLDSKCGANAPGGGGFQLGNTCAAGGDGGEGEGEGESDTFSPASTASDAEAYASSLGVRADYKGNVEVGNRVNEALHRARMYGSPLPNEVIVNDQHFIRTKSEKAACEYVSAYEQVYINSQNPIWQGAQRQTDGWLSSNDRLHEMTHEIGHHAHYKKGREEYHSVLSGRTRWTTEERAWVRDNISRYAESNPIEFVAETYAMASAGVRVPKEAYPLYKRFNGPRIGGLGR